MEFKNPKGKKLSDLNPVERRQISKEYERGDRPVEIAKKHDLRHAQLCSVIHRQSGKKVSPGNRQLSDLTDAEKKTIVRRYAHWKATGDQRDRPRLIQQDFRVKHSGIISWVVTSANGTRKSQRISKGLMKVAASSVPAAFEFGAPNRAVDIENDDPDLQAHLNLHRLVRHPTMTWQDIVTLTGVSAREAQIGIKIYQIEKEKLDE
jgi:hypothetical protein